MRLDKNRRCAGQILDQDSYDSNWRIWGAPRGGFLLPSGRREDFQPLPFLDPAVERIMTRTG